MKFWVYSTRPARINLESTLGFGKIHTMIISGKRDSTDIHLSNKLPVTINLSSVESMTGDSKFTLVVHIDKHFFALFVSLLSNLVRA